MVGRRECQHIPEIPLCSASVCFREKSSRVQTATETGETGRGRVKTPYSKTERV
jgi:hypothetical protein